MTFIEKRFSLGSHVAFSCQIFSFFLNLEPFRGFSLTFMTLTFLKITGQFFLENPSVWVCLIFPLLIGFMHLWREYHSRISGFSYYILASDAQFKYEPLRTVCLLII